MKKGCFGALRFVLLLAVLLTSCSTGGYWVPPSVENPKASIPTARAIEPSPTTASVPVDPIIPTVTPQQIGPAPTEVVAQSTPVQLSQVLPTPTTDPNTLLTTPILYYTQAADTLPVVAVRFGVSPSEITSDQPIPPESFLNPGQLLIIPRRLANTTAAQQLLPDSEIVNSPSTTDFDIAAFVNQAGGELSTYREFLIQAGTSSGAEVVQRVAWENSINPRLLLSMLEFHSGWVYGHPATDKERDYPLGHVDSKSKGLYKQLVWAVNQISIGYYAYREGRLTEIHFPDGVVAHLAPDLNAGTAALQYFFSEKYQGQAWVDALSLETGFPALHARMFGNPWERAQLVEPLYPPGIKQPAFILPFDRGWTWAFTGGPHGAWEHDGAYAALDFAPGSSESGCVKSLAWVRAAASGLVTRSGNGVVVLDLDGDGFEQTGWVLVYLHVSSSGRIPIGTWVDSGDQLGHPSCEGGQATGTHVHIARKYNGEWVPAAGPIPFNLSGWVAHASEGAYKGTLTRDGVTLTACICSNAATFITRGPDDP